MVKRKTLADKTEEIYLIDLAGNGYFKAKKLGKEGEFTVFEIISKKKEAEDILRSLPDEFFNFQRDYGGNPNLQLLLGDFFIGKICEEKEKKKNKN